MPDFSYNPSGYSFQLPSFSDVFGSNFSDLLSMVSNYRNQGRQQDYENQSKLLGQELGEQGRQFNISSDLQRDDQAKRYSYLDQELGLQKARDAVTNAAGNLQNNASMYDLWNKARAPLPWVSAPAWTFTSGYSAR